MSPRPCWLKKGPGSTTASWIKWVHLTDRLGSKLTKRRTPAGQEDARCSATELMVNVSLMTNVHCEDENPDPFHIYLYAKSINEQHNCSLDVYVID